MRTSQEVFRLDSLRVPIVLEDRQTNKYTRRKD